MRPVRQRFARRHSTMDVFFDDDDDRGCRRRSLVVTSSRTLADVVLVQPGPACTGRGVSRFRRIRPSEDFDTLEKHGDAPLLVVGDPVSLRPLALLCSCGLSPCVLAPVCLCPSPHTECPFPSDVHVLPSPTTTPENAAGDERRVVFGCSQKKQTTAATTPPIATSSTTRKRVALVLLVWAIGMVFFWLL